jgi:hypothetical protein
MALADWLASGADPARMTPEEIRRRQQLCAVREEQAASRLESLLAERDTLFRRGAETRSGPLRRVLARRWAHLDADVRALERELSRVGKEAAGLTLLRQLQKDGISLKAPGDCTPLLTLLDDTAAPEEEFANRLAMGLTGSRAEGRTGPVSADTGLVMAMWVRLDRGDVKSPDDAIRSLDDR